MIRNYNIMRPLSFRSDELHSLLLRNKIATLDELKQALGTSVNVTVYRKLKPLAYFTSYSHRGRYYDLREVARFDDDGLWSQSDVWFSRFGTLLASAEAFVNRSPGGYFADELARALHVEVQDALHQLAQQQRVAREIVSGRYLYTATDRAIRRGQLQTRHSVEAVAIAADMSVLQVAEKELKAAILLFYSLLDEQQRRLFAGLAAGAYPWKKTPEIIHAIEILLEHDTAGDPITGLKWTRMTTEKIAEVLREIDIPVSPNTVARLLYEMD